MRSRIPSVEAADHRQRPRIRRPYAEDRASYAIVRDEVRAHFFVNAIVAAFIEQVKVLVGEKPRGGEGQVRAHEWAEERVCISLPESRIVRTPFARCTKSAAFSRGSTPSER